MVDFPTLFMDMKQLGKALYNAIGETGITQRKLAQQVDCTPSHINNLINGKKRATPNLMARIYAAFKERSKFHAIQIIVAHLEDERERIGLSEEEIKIHIPSMCATCSAFRPGQICPAEGFCRQLKVPVDADFSCNLYQLDQDLTELDDK